MSRWQKRPVHCAQVVEKDADAVLDEVESAIYQAAVSILNGEGFTYDIPSRGRANQQYIPELDRIVLKDSKAPRTFASVKTCRSAVITTRILQLIHELCHKRIHVTKRDLFYTDVKLFEVKTSNTHGIENDQRRLLHQQRGLVCQGSGHIAHLMHMLSMPCLFM